MSTTMPTEAQRVQARRAFGFVLMSAVLPGSVQSFAGNQRIGRIATRVYGAVAIVVAIAVLGLLFARGFTVGLLLTPAVATVAKVALWVLFAGWVLLLLDAWRLSKPLRLAQRGRLGLTITAVVLILGLGGVTGLAASAMTGAANVGEVFQGGGETDEKAGRYNILLLGADASAKREGLRPDSINVASIDAATGRTVLFGLPRNMQRVPFPESSPLHEKYPQGFVCEDGGCMLNGVWTLGEDNKDLYPGKNAGLEATKEAVSEILGLDLNYYAMVDMGGFKSLIDAMGGIRLDIAKPIPVGGVSTKISRYIEPGKNRLLNGNDALWFARSRAESNDYERMVRQKCVMTAMVRQLDPGTVATKFVDLSQASKDILSTDVPSGEVVKLAELALKVKDQKIASVNFTPPMIVSAHPDFPLIRSTVKEKIEASEKLGDDKDGGKTSAKPTPTAKPTTSADPGEKKSEQPADKASAKPTRKASAKPTADPTVSPTDEAPYTETSDLDAVCSVSA